MLTARIAPNVISYSATISGLPFCFACFFEMSFQMDVKTLQFANVAHIWKKQGCMELNFLGLVFGLHYHAFPKKLV